MLLSQRWFMKVSTVVVLALALTAPNAVAGDGTKNEASAEMKFGYKAAKRGYWQEALLRFEHANQLTPDQPRILNNIAVAQEANGRFEEALLTYQTGLAIDPKDNALRRNYARFQEFYSSYVAPPEDITTDEAEGTDDAKQDN